MPNLVSFTSAQDPELQAIERRRRLAEMLQQQAAEPMPVQQNAPISPLSGLAKALRGYTAGSGMRKADEAEKAYGENFSKELSAVLGGDLTSTYKNPQAQMLAAQLRMEKERREADAAGKQVTNLTDEEEKGAGLNPAGVYQRDTYGKITPLWEPPQSDMPSAERQKYDRDMYSYKAGIDAANREPDKPEPPRSLNVLNMRFPDGTVKSFDSVDEAGIKSAMQAGAVEQSQERALAPAISPKDISTAKSKLLAIKALKGQLAEAKTKLAALKDSGSLGMGQGWVPSEAGQAYDAAVDIMRGGISGLTRTPGIGSMSDFETRLDQAKIPTRGGLKHEATTVQQLQQLEDYVNTLESGYLEMLGPDVGAETPTEKKRIKLDANGNEIP